jgi:nucleotide-binding universal stress UspA family protein
MNNTEKILVGTDLSPRSQVALTRAAYLAEEQEAALTALHVIPGAEGDQTFIDALRLEPALAAQTRAAIFQAAQAELERQLAALPATPAAHAEVQAGSPYVKVIQKARADNADVIVLGAHGEEFARELLFGTTAERIIRNGDRPVLVVKQPPEGAYRKVLVAVDFSDTSCTALQLALRLAPQAEITALHVYEVWYEPRLRGIMTEDQLVAVADQHAQQVRKDLAAFVRRCDVTERKVRRMIRRGYPGRVIARLASTTGADLVAVGTHGLGGLRHVLLGSVAEHVLRESRSDVLVVHPKTFQFALP